MRIKQFFFILLLLHSSISFSQVIQIKVTDYGWLESIPPLKPLLDDYLETVEQDLNRDQPIRDTERLMEGTANSTALASKGVGSDYASYMKKYLVGASLGVAIDAEKDVGLEDEVSGLGGAAGIIFGARMSELEIYSFFGLDLNKLAVYANAGGVSHSRIFPGIDDTDLDAEISATNLGLHFRYDWIDGSGDEWFGWGGIKTHFGYDFSYNTLTFQNDLDQNLELDTGFGILNGQLKGTPRYKIKTNIHSFPFEISSDVRFLKVFTIFGGTGVDFNFGKSVGSGEVKADVTPLFCSSGICSNLDLPETKIEANLDNTENVDALTIRGFAGLQLNISRVRIFGQVNKVFGNEVVGASAGIRVLLD